MSNKQNADVVWVDSNERFEELAKIWLDCDFLAIDTEFERRTTYYPILALVQVFDGKNVYLIDPFQISCNQVFRQVCESDRVVKIMHSAREDIEVLYFSWHCRINNLFDTQIAYAFVSGEISKGYAALVEKLCSQTLDKQETQSDWKARPLSEKQITYAANDVLFLPEIYTQLKSQINQLPSSEVFVSECRELVLLAIKMPDFSRDYRLVNEVWLLNEHQLGLFQQLYQWREKTAIAENRTRNHLMRDPQLVQIARYQPESKSALKKIPDVHPKTLRLYGEQLIDLIKSFNQTPVAMSQLVTNPRDITELNRLSELLSKVIKQTASELCIAPGLIVSKRVLKKIAYAYLANEPFPDSWLGWRGKLLSNKFNQIFSQYLAKS